MTQRTGYPPPVSQLPADSSPQAGPAWRAALPSLALILVVLGYLGYTSPVYRTLAGISDRGPTPGLEDEPFFPPEDPAVSATLLAARSSLTARADGTTPVGPGRTHPGDCLLSLYVPMGGGLAGPYVGGVEGSVDDAVAAIFDQLPPRAREPSAISRSRVKLDCPIGGERAIPQDGGRAGMALDKGLDGVVLRVDGRPPFRWLPSWGIEKPVARSGIVGNARKMARRMAGWKKSDAATATATAFRTRAYVDDPLSPGLVTPLARANADAPPLEPAAIRDAITAAGEYLARETDSAGKLTYHYDDRKDSVEGGYNLLRHAGSTYSILQAYRISGDPFVLEAAVRAMGYFRRQMREDAEHPGEWFPLEGRRVKLGGAGLGLLMFAEHAKIAPQDTFDIELLRGLGRHIQRMQQPSGEFTSFYNWDGREKSTRKSIFYSGEAILGLMRLHQLTGEREWLDTAIRGADFLVHERWTALGIRLYVPADAWLVQALEEMDRVAPDDARADYAFALGRSIAQLKLLDESVTPVDLLGGEIAGLGRLPPTATSGSFGEGLSACARLEARRRPSSTKHREDAAKNARYQLRSQLRRENTYYLSNPERALGGFRKRMASGEIRNDHVQHNLSGLFGILTLYDESAPDIGLVVTEPSS